MYETAEFPGRELCQRLWDHQAEAGTGAHGRVGPGRVSTGVFYGADLPDRLDVIRRQALGAIPRKLDSPGLALETRVYTAALCFDVINRHRLGSRCSASGYGAGSLFVQLMMQAVERQFQAIGNAELVIHLPQIVFDDLLSRTKLVGNFLVALALGNAGDDGQLFRGKTRLGSRAGQRSRLRTIGLNNPVDRLVVDPGFPGCDLTHAFYQQVRRDRPGNDAPDTAAVKLHCVGLIVLG